MADAAFDDAVLRMKNAALAQDVAQRRTVRASADYELAVQGVNSAREAVNTADAEVVAAHIAFQDLVKGRR